jgi:orotidine-5'-phosphate decarboxylase
MGVKMFNVHASCGIKAMMAAVANKGDSLVLAVTVLTSLDGNNVKSIFGAQRSEDKVLQLAYYAEEAGCDGIICSPQEIKILKKQRALDHMLKITTDIIPEWADREQIMTPYEAIKAGADYVVIGSPITNPPIGMTPVDAAKKIAGEITKALNEMDEQEPSVLRGGVKLWMN